MRVVEKVIGIGNRLKSERLEGAYNSKVVFYMHLQLIKNNIFNVVFC